MKLILKNHFFRLMTLSNFFNNLGSAIYNLVFVIYVAEVYQSKTMLFIANNIMMLPIYFQIFIGFQSDRTKNKSKALILSGYTQAILFCLVAYLTQNVTFISFSLICLINIIDDLLAIYCSQLRLPFYKYYLSDDNELREAFSFGHFVGIVSGLIGQVLGVWLLTISQNNYALVAIINAMSFFISTLLLLGILKDYDKKKEFTRVESELPPRSENRLKDLVSVTQKAFATIGGNISAKRLILALILQFALAGAENTVFNIYFLNHPIGDLSYKQVLIGLNIASTCGLIIGDLTPNDWFSRQSYPFLLWLNGLITALFGFLCLFNYRGYFLFALLFLTAFIFAKSSPKLTSQLLMEIPEEFYGQVMSSLSTITQLAIPIGAFVLSSLVVWKEDAAWVLYTIVAMLSVLILSFRRNKKLTN